MFALAREFGWRWEDMMIMPLYEIEKFGDMLVRIKEQEKIEADRIKRGKGR